MAVREATLAGLGRQELVDLHYQMVLLRRFEEKAAEEYTLGKIGGFLHLYIGQEATGVGAISAMRANDYVVSSYREHGHAILKGLEPRAVMAELLGKSTGCSRGKGGSMHMYSAEHRLIGGQAIVGAQLVIGVGIGFGAQYQGLDDVVFVMFGDGAVDEGAFHEALNLAALWKLPVVFLCENNQYSMGMAVTKAWSVQSLEPRAAAYGMPYAKVDGMDVLAVRDVVAAAAERARTGAGPTLIESLTYRFRGHSMADPARYRGRDEEEQWKSTRDPIVLFERKLHEAGLLRDEDISANEARADDTVEDAVRFADESPDPSPDELFENVTIENAGAIAWRTRASTPRD
ncbi:MAG TPA: pyruvate dehydrogenase (acetyl-transferring) E1 component subunit alpha [Ktedonobacterales bacterium]|nr:pyruvate dehydrogenase (acetyl-transferring) E1 component subunit alpha [Ktedonobacterales bacterium]